jgi:hypothetical protein
VGQTRPDLIHLRHCSALTTRNGRFFWRPRKWRFSLTKQSAPTHSVYAAINASAGLSPLRSYWVPSSNGTTKSSSGMASRWAYFMASCNSEGVRLRRISRRTKRGIRSLWSALCRDKRSTKATQAGCLLNPKANKKILLSRTMRKLFVPQVFPRLTQLRDNLLFRHFQQGRVALGDHAPNFLQRLAQDRSVFLFHCQLPLSSVYQTPPLAAMTCDSL